MAFSKQTEWTVSSAMEQAYRLLNQRWLSSYEMRKKLKERFVPEEIIEEVERELIRLSYIDDERLQEELIEHYKELKKYSSYVIREKMRQRGLSVGDGLGDYDECDVAIRLLHMRFHINDEDYLEAIEVGNEEKIAKKKVIYFLKNRGFSVATMQMICSEWALYLE